ncbi:hypothetical protein IMZ11_16245 [Microtetraspora sp. AC03309]|uniref:hypothetical protein n=1 Tax=Microtetraspora sp. AC03309 TaxID=2779376 RepID=UPI001E5DC756|nr:hypothetical protein [Microtetraspora sp. AC03309]MCC5577178.1 hypothetical protein [Microtetraspora sp. AC03309]
MRIMTALPVLALPLLAVPAPAQAAARQVSGATFLGYEGTAAIVHTYLPGKGFTKTKVGTMIQISAAPDGKKVAWVDDNGRLHVTQGTRDTVVAKGAVSGVPCATPVWSADSTRIAYAMTAAESMAPIGIVGADGKNRRKIGKSYGVCHLAWSAGGRYLAGYAGTTDGVFLLDTTIGKTRRAAGIKLANHVQSLSPDGRRVIVNKIGASSPGGDGSWPLWFRPTLVDTVTGSTIKLPVKGSLIGATYLTDGRLAVRVKGTPNNTIVVLGTNLKEVQRMAEPAQARKFALLGLMP